MKIFLILIFSIFLSKTLNAEGFEDNIYICKPQQFISNNLSIVSIGEDYQINILDGQEILDLGCGWGSFSLYAAAKFPESNITSVSNSFDQINFINEEAEKRNLKNIKAIKMDVNNLNLDNHFDRIISIEMFEHLRNYKSILSSLSSLLKDNGKLFIHIFCNKEITYLYEVRHDLDWMTKYFLLFFT